MLFYYLTKVYNKFRIRGPPKPIIHVPFRVVDPTDLCGRLWSVELLRYKREHAKLVRRVPALLVQIEAQSLLDPKC